MKKITITNYFTVAMKWRHFIVRNVFIVSVLAIIISLLLPNKYTATATMLPPNLEQQAMLGMLSGNIPTGLAGLASMGGLLPGVSTPSDLFAAIMESKRIKGEIIEKYNLKKEFKTKTMIDAYKALDKITDIEISIEGIVSVNVTYKNRYLAADIANSFVEELDKFNTETTMTVGKKYRIFIEQRLKDTEDTLTQTESALRNFQEKHRTVALDVEIESAIQTIAKLKSQIILLEVKKGALSSSSQYNNPYLYDINKELRELKKQLSKIEFGEPDTTKKEFGAGFSVPFVKLPEVALEYARLFRDVEIQTAIYGLLTQQYEQAKIMELKDTPTVQVLDKAQVPEKKSYPRRSLIVIFAFLFSLLANVPLIFLLEYLTDIKTRPTNHTFATQFSSDLSSDFVALKQFIRKIFMHKKH